MATPIHVLVVQDSAAEAERTIAHLCEAGYAPVWRQVAAVADYIAALAEPYDLILADFQSPTLPALDALRLLREHGASIPLILLSSPLSDEQAVECIKLGARFYVPKERSALLGAAVERALAEAAMRAAQREVEEALRRSEAHYRAIVDSPLALICRWLPDGRLTYINETYAAVFGKKPQELIGQRWADLLPQADRGEIEETYAQVVEDAQPVAVEHPIIDVQGRRRLIVWTDSPIFDADGNLVEYQSMGQDVTELRRVEQQIKLLTKAVEQSPVSIIITDRSGEIIYVNPHAVAAGGYSEAEMLGRKLSILKVDLTPPAVHDDLWRTVLSGRRWRGEVQDRRKTGEPFWVSAQISPITDGSGQITHLVAVQEDITDRREREAELRRLNEQLELRVEERTVELRTVNVALQRAARAKDEFLASMSHELRTPLAGILALAEGLEDGIYGPLTDRQARTLQAMQASGEHLLELINDILDVAKAEAGLMEPHFEYFAVSDVCQGSLNLIRGMAHKKHLRVSFSITPAAIGLEADPRRLKQILVNLLSNAVKFTPEERDLGLEVTADAETQIVRFCVWDRGIGIAKEDLPRLFQPFTQLDASLAREYTGTGLGLALVRNMAEMHGGSITVESTLGVGSRFTVTIPWRQPSAPFAAEPPVEQPPAPLTALVSGVTPLILLADDNETTGETYKAYLEARGCRVATAQRGSEAVRLAEVAHPALILMDIQMPGMDGLTAIRRLRASRDQDVAATPIVALTALALPGDRERCLEAGADEYLSKPVPLSMLVEVISALLKR